MQNVDIPMSIVMKSSHLLNCGKPIPCKCLCQAKRPATSHQEHHRRWNLLKRKPCRTHRHLVLKRVPYFHRKPRLWRNLELVILSPEILRWDCTNWPVQMLQCDLSSWMRMDKWIKHCNYICVYAARWYSFGEPILFFCSKCWLVRRRGSVSYWHSRLSGKPDSYAPFVHSNSGMVQKSFV